MNRLQIFALLSILVGGCKDEPLSSYAQRSENDNKPLKRVEAQRPLMGTLFKITTYTTDPEKTNILLDTALDLAQDFAEKATDYAPESELNQLPKPPIKIPKKVSSNLFEVLNLAHQISAKTNGLFDPTYGPLTHLWRRSRDQSSIPSAVEIAQAQSRCGIEKITLNPKSQTITFHHPNMQLDLGGIAKGFAADLIFEFLKKNEHPISLVAAGGDLRLGDPPPEKDGWITELRSFRLAPSQIIELKNCAISTSGDLFQKFRHNGKTYSHIISPKTGLGLTESRSASVIHSRASYTDPLATAACLSKNPKTLAEKFPNASLRILYKDRRTHPVITGRFLENQSTKVR